VAGAVLLPVICDCRSSSVRSLGSSSIGEAGKVSRCALVRFPYFQVCRHFSGVVWNCWLSMETSTPPAPSGVPGTVLLEVTCVIVALSARSD
jgi:hypothetical protein